MDKLTAFFRDLPIKRRTLLKGLTILGASVVARGFGPLPVGAAEMQGTFDLTEASAVASDLARYITGYYGFFMTASEFEAFYHLVATLKVTYGRSDLTAQAEAVRKGRTVFPRDPVVLDLVREGYDAFLERTAHRILAEHSSEIFLNTCPKCGALKRTPVARPCRHCRTWAEPTISEAQRKGLPGLSGRS